MMNVVALCFVLSSLVTAGVWSPTTPEKHNPSKEDLILKERQRVVVVEYETERNRDPAQETRVPEVTPELEDKSSYIAAAKDKLSTAATTAKESAKEAASVLPNPQNDGPVRRSGELICDALGKCRHKLASALSRTKDKVSEKAHDVTDKAEEVGEHAKEAVSDAFGRAKETVSDKTDRAREAVKETAEQAKDRAGTLLDMSNTVGLDVQRNVTTTVTSPKDMAVKAGETAKQVAGTVAASAHSVKEEGEKELREILRRARDVAYDAVAYAVSPRKAFLAMRHLHLLGFSMAYGMCMWVTFISSHVLANSLPKQQYGVVQSRMYPVYFKVMAFSVGLAMIGHLVGQWKLGLFSNRATMLQAYNLLASLLMLLFNSLYLEPRATKVMFERMKLEKEEGRGGERFMPVLSMAADSISGPQSTGGGGERTEAETISTRPVEERERREQEMNKSRAAGLSERLKILNSLNILTLMSLSWHLIYLGSCLRTTT